MLVFTIIIIIIIINQLAIVGVAVYFSPCVILRFSAKKKKKRNYNDSILIQILKGISHPLKDLKWIL